MLRRSLAKSAGHFWQPAEFENMANPDFKNLKHFQTPGHLPLNAPSKCVSHTDSIIDLLFHSVHTLSTNILKPLNYAYRLKS